MTDEELAYLSDHMDAIAKRVAKAMGFEHWTIQCESDIHLPDGVPARIRAFGAYKMARIEIDLWQHDNPADVARSIRHELLHLVLSPVDFLYSQIRYGISDDPKLVGLLENQSSDSIERVIANIEGILDHIEEVRHAMEIQVPGGYTSSKNRGDRW